MLRAQRASECLPALPVVAVAAAVVVVAAVERTGESGTGTETAVPSANAQAPRAETMMPSECQADCRTERSNMCYLVYSTSLTNKPNFRLVGRPQFRCS